MASSIETHSYSLILDIEKDFKHTILVLVITWFQVQLRRNPG